MKVGVEHSGLGLIEFLEDGIVPRLTILASSEAADIDLPTNGTGDSTGQVKVWHRAVGSVNTDRVLLRMHAPHLPSCLRPRTGSGRIRPPLKCGVSVPLWILKKRLSVIGVDFGVS